MKWLILLLSCAACLGQGLDLNDPVQWWKANVVATNAPATTNHAGYGTNLAQCSLWLTAEDIFTESTLVTNWVARKSGITFTHSDNNSRPYYLAAAVNGKPSLSFHQGVRWLSNAPPAIRIDNIASTGQVSIFVVARPTNTTSQSIAFLSAIQSTSDRIGLQMDGATTNVYFDAYNNGTGRLISAPPANFVGSWHIVECIRSNAYEQIMVDGTSCGTRTDASGAASSSTPIFCIGTWNVGTSEPFVGQIAEVCILTNCEAAARIYIRTNQAFKYGITLP